jgi:Transposase IS116/IS110/IS902 family
MNPTIEELTAAAEREAGKRPAAMRLMTHPGVGPITAVAYVLIIGTPTRFQRDKQIGTYVGRRRSQVFRTLNGWFPRLPSTSVLNRRESGLSLHQDWGALLNSPHVLSHYASNPR